MTARLFVVAGPSGVGKGTLIRRVLPSVGGIGVATSATTRPRRPDEVDGREYHFLTVPEFNRRVEAGEFLEHVTYADHRYGTLRSEVERRLADGESVVLEIDVVGAGEIKRRLPNAVLVFVSPPTMDDLESRLTLRNTDPPEVIARRLRIARDEMEAKERFDHTIVNADVERAAAELAGLIRRETTAEETR
ncbi:MAG TPA: guanylate kinase [Gaiellales bacterium]|nr:guanylate kinase [Gaiellales bacterium]